MKNILFLFLIVSISYSGTKYTASGSGNWRTIFANTLSSDTEIINAQNYKITIPAGETDTARFSMTGTGSGWANLSDSGTLVLCDSLTQNTLSQIWVWPGASIQMKGKKISCNRAGTSKQGLYIMGTPVSRAKVHGNNGGIWSYFGSGYSEVDYVLKYADFDSLGQCLFTYYTTTGMNDSVYNCTFRSCDNLNFSTETNTTSNIYIGYNDFRNYSGAGGEFIHATVDGPSTATRRITHNTFSNSDLTKHGYVNLYGNSWVVDSNVFRTTNCYAQTGRGNVVHNNVYYIDSLSPYTDVGQLTDSCWFYKNYYYSAHDNPHCVSVWAAIGTPKLIDLYKNAFELKIHHYTDNGDVITSFNTEPNMIINIHHNLVLDSNSAWLQSWGNGTRSGAVNVWNNTMRSNGTASGLLTNNENGAIILTGTDSLWNNLVMDYDSAGTLSRGINIVTAGTNQISYTDYQDWVGINNRYFQVTFSPSKTWGTDAGFGSKDTAIYPYFTDTTRNIAKWNLVNGSGVKKDTSAIVYMLGANGYNSINQDQSGTINGFNIWQWIMDGYHPTNKKLIGIQRSKGDSLTNSFGTDSVVKFIWLDKKIDSSVTGYNDSFELSSYVDSATLYLQDSIAGGTWGTRTTSSMTVNGTHGRITRTGISVSGKYYEKIIAITNQGAKDTTSVDSITIPSGIGPSLSSIIPDTSTVQGGKKIAINGTNFSSSSSVKIGNGGYAGATSQTMTSVSTTIDTITTTAFSRGLYKVYVTDNAGNVDSSKTFYFKKTNISYIPSSYTETQGVISPGYLESTSQDPWDSIGYKTVLSTGLSLNHSSGYISGTPTVAQSAIGYVLYSYLYGYKNDSTTVTITVTSNTPIVSSLSSSKLKTGDTLTLTGSLFGASQGGSTVSFGTTLASNYVSWSSSQVKVVVPTLSRSHYLMHLCTSYCDSSQTLTLINLCDKPAIQSPLNGAIGVPLTPTLNARRIK